MCMHGNGVAQGPVRFTAFAYCAACTASAPDRVREVVCPGQHGQKTADVSTGAEGFQFRGVYIHNAICEHHELRYTWAVAVQKETTGR